MKKRISKKQQFEFHQMIMKWKRKLRLEGYTDRKIRKLMLEVLQDLPYRAQE